MGRLLGFQTDGQLTDSSATEGANNPSDSNEGWDGSGDYTNNYFAAKGEIHVAMKLAAGKYTITAYLNSYQSSMSAAIYDGNNNFVVGKLLCGEHGGGEGYVVTFTLEVTAESEFKLIIGKSRSHGEDVRQVGWQAIAVAQITE